MRTKDELLKRRATLSNAQLALLEKRLQRESNDNRDQAQAQAVVTSLPGTPLEPLARLQGAPLPLSFAQRRFWFLQQLEPESGAYNDVVAVRLHGDLDRDAATQALREVARRHEVLCCTFPDQDGQPVVRVDPTLPDHLLFPVTDFCTQPLLEREQRVRQWAKAEMQRPFRLSEEVAWRARLLRLGEQEHIFLLVMHHIITDAWSQEIFVRDLLAFYASARSGQAPRLPDLSVQYADYAHWQEERLQGVLLERQMSYWKERLGNKPAPLGLPTDRPRSSVMTYRGRRIAWTLPPALSQQLRSFSRQEGVTLFMTLLATLNVLFYRYSRQSDILIGVPVAARLHPELENVLGCFVNTLVLRTDLADTPTFRELLQRVRQLTLDAYEHQEIPFEKLVEELQPERDMSRSPFFQVVFSLQNVPLADQIIPDLSLSPFAIESETARLDLSLVLKDTNRELSGYIEYNTDLFDEETIKQMQGHLQVLLEALVIQPDSPISTLPLLREAEQRQLLEEWNGPSLPFAEHSSFSALFEEQVQRVPEAIAVRSGGEQLTYRELDRRADRLADCLRELQIGPETVVALLLERGVELLSTILAIFKVGAAYLPLDLHHPAARLRQILLQSQAALLLVSANDAPSLAETLSALPPSQRPILLSLQDLRAPGAREKRQACLTKPQTAVMAATQLAYIIYTSGSTGRPKGAMVEQRGMLNHLHAKIRDLQLGESDSVAQTASQCFDISVWQMLAALLVGGQVCIYPDEIAHDPALLLAALERDRVSILEVVPSFLRTLLEEQESEKWRASRLSSLRWMIPTGEALPAQLCQAWLSRYPDIPLLNAYGPSECSDDVTHLIIRQVAEDERGSMPLGRALGNLQLYVLDEYMQLLPTGVPGEIYIGGTGVGRGYRGEPARTAAAFVPDPFGSEPGKRLYKTGDRGRYRRDGIVEWEGREDQQVKVRGYRIELEEIEAALSQHPAIRQGIVQVRASESGHSALLAFIVLRPGEVQRVEELQAFLRERLPEYMVPSVFCFLEQMPLLPNGKVDRRTLQMLEADSISRDSSDFVAARNPLEEMLVNIWVNVLQVERASIFDDFFALGGHSLLATRIVARIRETLRVEISLRTFFLLPTIAQLAEHIRAARLQEASLASPALPRLKAGSRREKAPLSYTQQRQWFLDQLETGGHFATTFGAVRLNGPLSIAALEQSVQAIVQRHEALRTTFAISEGEPVQIVAPELLLPVSLLDLQSLPWEEREALVMRLCEQEKQHPYDLARGPLLRVTLLCLAPQEHILLLGGHQILFDGWSNDIFLHELALNYLAFTRNEAPSLPALPVQYADYAAWQQEWLRGEALDKLLIYWKQQLAELPALTLPADHARPALWNSQAARVPVNLSAQLTGALKELSKRESVSLFMILLAAYQAVLARYSGQQDIVVGSPIANRRWAELEEMIGSFMNTLVLRVDLSGNPSFRSLLAQVRAVTLDAYTHQDLPFEKLVEELQPERALNRNPLFQALFALQNGPQQQVSLPELSAHFLHLESETTMFDLDLSLWEEQHTNGSELVGGFKYCKALFNEATIQRIKEDWLTLLELIVADPTQRIGDLPLLSSAEQQRLLRVWNSTQQNYERDRCIFELFEAQVARTPDALAALHGDEYLTYTQLNVQANQLAHRLRALGVRPGVTVAVYMERGLELLPALLGILKAGGTYVPLETSFPAERLAWILAALNIPILLTQSTLMPLLDKLEAQSLRHILCLDAHLPVTEPEARSYSIWSCADIETLPGENLPRQGSPDDLAYIIFTSGSTGRPKGVMVRHRPVINLIEWVNKTFAMSSADRVLFITSLCFDLSVYDIFGLLAAGGSIQIVSDLDLKEPEVLLQYLQQQPITFWDSAPAALQQLLPFFQERDPSEAHLTSKLRLVFLSGDWIPVTLPDSVRAQFPGAEIVSLGGATEATVWSNFYRIRDVEPHWTSIPYGKPIQNARYYILDAFLNPCPPGVPGDLYIGGECLASGYIGEPELTAQKFLPDPFATSPGMQLYKTGDRARFWQDGNIEFLGRVDFQVKIRGFRVELGEVEAALARHPAVQTALVEAKAISNQITSEKRLIAYIVARAGQEVSPHELRLMLRKQLPAYMLPSAFLFLDALPVTANGKVDRRRLPLPDIQLERRQAEAYIAPTTAHEERMSEIWSEILRRPQISTADNFFEIGGHSLLAVQLIARVRAAWQIELPLRSLFEAPSIAELSARVEQALSLQLASIAEPELDLLQEALLDPTIQPGEPYRRSPDTPRAIFLTGATGFLGSVLLAELLQQTSADIYCLMRCSSEEEGRSKLQKLLSSAFLWQPAFRERIIPLKGDLEQPLLGLSKEQFEQLARKIDILYHSGARVNMLYSYSDLKAANVLGTQEVLRLAASQRVKPLHYISTLSVFSPDAVQAGQLLNEHEALDPHSVHMPDGYAQSKWVAEKLVSLAGLRGLPVTIYRPGRLTGHSQTGAWRTNDELCRMIKGCIQLGTIPTLVAQDRLAITPVDYVSRAIVALARQESSPGKIFHLDSQVTITAGELATWINQAGYPLRQVPYAEWRKTLEHASENVLSPFLSIFPQADQENQASYQRQDADLLFDNTETLQALESVPLACPSIDAELIATYLAYFSRIGFLRA